MFTDLRRYLADLLFLLGSHRSRLPWILGSFFLVAFLDLLGLAVVGAYIVLLTQSEGVATGLLATLVNTFKLDSNPQSKLLLGLSLIAIFTVKGVAAVLVQRHILLFAADQGVRLRTRLSSVILEMSFETFTSRNSSEYVQGLVTYVNQFSSSVVSLLRLAAEGVIAVSIGLMLLTLNGVSVLLLIGIALVLFIAYDQLTGARLKRAGQSQNEGGTLMIQGVQEGVSGLKELRILGCEPYFLSQIQRGSQQWASAGVFVALMGVIPRYLVEIAVMVFIVGLLGIFMMQGSNLEAMYPVIGILGVAAVRLGPATSMILQTAARLRAGRPAITALRQEFLTITKAPIHTQRQGDSGKRRSFQSLELDEVVFSYREATRPAIDRVSLTLAAGESIGLTGASGAGKTTMVDVILGLFSYQAGEIRYNGEQLADCLQDWWSSVAYLPQEVFLVDATLEQNVALNIKPEDIDEQRLNNSLAQARLTDLSAELPQGVKTLIGEKGIRLSGGQRQRVALARALYHRRDVLVMDEATSALDYETEREIVEEIRRLKGKKTMIVIAHRLSTLQHCDRIYRLERGRIAAINSYAEAVANQPEFTASSSRTASQESDRADAG
jgi:ABC-type multidrug transport system fused ATPase/permease subunit